MEKRKYKGEKERKSRDKEKGGVRGVSLRNW